MNPCDDFGSHSKKHFADALKNKHVDCKECDPVQKHISHILDQVIHQEEYKEYLDVFRTKYDPEGKYLAEFEESVKDY
ncbi:uncharacterized protein LOC121727925 isoform X2 [Aricia agestis]|nr:uncharacterized protein LOC121727925 isoform X2 [Aricia agestis]